MYRFEHFNRLFLSSDSMIDCGRRSPFVLKAMIDLIIIPTLYPLQVTLVVSVSIKFISSRVFALSILSSNSDISFFIRYSQTASEIESVNASGDNPCLSIDTILSKNS